MRVVLVQLAIDYHVPEQNRERAAKLLSDAHALDPVPPRSLLILPELFSTGTLPPDFDAGTTEAIAAADRLFLAGLARTYGSYVLAGVLKASGDGSQTTKRPLNTALLLDPEARLLLQYAKIHPFSLGGEDRIFTGGDSVPTASVEGFTLQAVVCYDLRFPELFRAKNGAGMASSVHPAVDLFGIPANWPESRREHWDVLLRARAIENQSFVAGVNCVGVQRGTRYAGGSCLVSPKGEVLVSAGEEECVVSAEISADHVKSWRRVFPALRDRKPEGFWT